MDLKIKIEPKETECILDLSIHNPDLIEKIKKDIEELGSVSDKTRYEIDMFSLSCVEKLIVISWEISKQ